MLFTLFVLIFTIFIFFLYRRITFWRRQGVDGPLNLGLDIILKDHNEYLVEQGKIYGRVYGGNLLSIRYLAINDPELIKEIFVINGNNIFTDHCEFYPGPSPRTNKMIFHIPGDEDWKRVRSIISPTFTTGKLKAMCSHMTDVSDNFLRKLKVLEKQGGEIDLHKSVDAFSMDVICACAYGIKIDSLENMDNPFITNAKKTIGTDVSFSRVTSAILPKLAKLLRLEFFDKKAVDYLCDLTNKIVSERKKLHQNSTSRIPNFIEILMDSDISDKNQETIKYMNNNKNGEQILSKTGIPLTLTPDELGANSILFFTAGYDTTSSAITHLIHYMAENQDCQQKLYEELKDVTDFSWDNLSQLKYLNAVINETLRLSPPVLRIMRMNNKDFEINGIKIPKGTQVEYYPYVLHRDPQYWTDPLVFNPKRFLEPKHNPFAYLPFGAGHRHCVGERFALNQIRICATKLFKEFAIMPSIPGSKLNHFNANAVLKPKNLMTIIKSRNGSE